MNLAKVTLKLGSLFSKKKTIFVAMIKNVIKVRVLLEFGLIWKKNTKNCGTNILHIKIT